MITNLFEHIKGSLGLSGTNPLRTEAAPANPKQQIVQMVSIPGTTQAMAELSLHRAHGINPHHVIDVVVADEGPLSAEATFALRNVHREGGTRGPAAAAVAAGVRALRPEERLYFVLVGHPPTSNKSLMAFVTGSRVARV